MSQVHDLALKLKRGAGSLAGAVSLLVVLNASPAFACPVAGVTFAQLQAAQGLARPLIPLGDLLGCRLVLLKMVFLYLAFWLFLCVISESSEKTSAGWAFGCLQA
jgi:hypothetical protein